MRIVCKKNPLKTRETAVRSALLVTSGSCPRLVSRENAVRTALWPREEVENVKT